MKKWIFIPFLIISILSIIFLCFYGNIRSHFHCVVKTKDKISLYNKDRKKVGSLYKNLTLELDNKSKNLLYFKLKNYPYYVYYKDIQKAKKKTSKKENHYLEFDKRIRTNKNTIFLNLNNQKAIKMKDCLTFSTRYIDDNYFYVDYLNDTFKVKKSDVSLQDINKVEEEEATYISVIHYEDISLSCNQKECVDSSNVKKQMKLLEKLGYYTINFDEYEKYLKKNIRLRKNAVLLTTTKKNQLIEQLNNQSKNKIEIIHSDNYHFLDINMKSTEKSKLDSIERYVVQNTTSLEEFQKMLEGNSIITNPTNEIPVLNYHFFYDEKSGEECNESICLDVGDFREQLNYLRDNGYKTVTMEEFKRWMYYELELPEKSILITVDDGALGTGRHNGNKLIPILEEYKMHATLFLIAGWWDINNYQSDYLEIESHTFNMHQYGSCGLGEVLCEEKEDVVNDLKKSIEVIRSNNAFCFPFYNYNQKSIEAVREVGFQLAFIGGYQKAKRTEDKYKIPRYPIHKTTSIREFINMVS